MKTITLTVLEIMELAECAGLIVAKPATPLDNDGLEVEYTVFESDCGIAVGDEDGKNPQPYRHAAYISEYPEEGTYPLGDPLI